jgi:uncharacterized SAM-binding protein YcdF (DUF218 family)
MQRSVRANHRARIGLLALVACLTFGLLAPYGLIVRSRLARADAIVMLSGSSVYIERAQWAARLWREGCAPLIVLTNDGQSAGWDDARQRNPSFAERAADELQRQGVPANVIETIPQVVTGTHDEAARVREYAQLRGLRSVQFVTSVYHTRRALWTINRLFANSGIETAMDAPPAGQQSPAPSLWWTKETGWKSVPGEYLKFIYYCVRY